MNFEIEQIFTKSQRCDKLKVPILDKYTEKTTRGFELHFPLQIVTSKLVFLLLPILALGNHRESHKISRKLRDQPLSSDDYEEPEIVEKSESTALVRMTRSGYLPPKPEWPPEKQAKWKQYMAALGRYPGKNPPFR